jgi:hypothetical protein
MKTVREMVRAVARALELDRLFDREKSFFVRPGQPPVSPSTPPPDARPEAIPCIEIRMGGAFISPTVSARPEDSAGAVSPFATGFRATWRPRPAPPEDWIDLLMSAPFGTQATSARELRWNGREVSVERVTEAEIEAFVAQMESWAEYANRELANRRATPAARAHFEAQARARRLQERLRR